VEGITGQRFALAKPACLHSAVESARAASKMAGFDPYMVFLGTFPFFIAQV
jgi:hypothetical protein